MGKMDHITPDFTIKHDSKKAESAQKKLEGLREKEADLVQELAELRKEISLTAGEAKTTNQPGFSNADGKAQKAATTKLEQSVTEAATVKAAPKK